MEANGAPVGRRVVLGMLGAGALGILFGSHVQDWLDHTLARVEVRDGTGLSSLLPLERFRIYSVVGSIPEKDDASYRLAVKGLVSQPLTLTLADLRAMPPTSLTRDFQCVTGWRVHKVPWRGVLLSDLLDSAGVTSSARAVTFRSFDGAYTESLTIDEARRSDVIVAYEMEGHAVSSQHGGPVRLYVAPMYGYKSCKWLDTIEAVDRVEPGYWEQQGYDQEAWVGGSNGRTDAPI